MKIRALVAVLLATLAAAGCHPGGETGDPSVGAAAGPPAATQANQARPGTPGGPPLNPHKPPPAKDPFAGRTGAAAGQ